MLLLSVFFNNVGAAVFFKYLAHVFMIFPFQNINIHMNVFLTLGWIDRSDFLDKM